MGRHGGWASLKAVEGQDRASANGPVARWVGGLAIVAVAVVAGVYVLLTVLSWFGLG